MAVSNEPHSGAIGYPAHCVLDVVDGHKFHGGHAAIFSVFGNCLLSAI